MKNYQSLSLLLIQQPLSLVLGDATPYSGYAYSQNSKFKIQKDGCD